MKFKRIIALLLAFVFVLSACGQTTDKDTKKEETKAEEAKAGEAKADDKKSGEKAELEEATIVFWHAMNGDQEEALTELAKKFMEANPKVKVDLQNQTGYAELQQKITATSTTPDALPTMTQAYPDWMFNPIKDGLVEDLTDYTASVENYDDILEGFRKGTQIDGKVYSMPFNKSTEVLWYNEDLLKEVGVEVPKTPEELKEVSKKIFEAKKIPGVGFDSLSNYYVTFLNQEGVAFDNKLDPTAEASIKAANYYLEGVKEGYFRIAGTDKFMSGPLGNQQVAMYIGSNAGESFVKQGAEGKFTAKAARSPFETSIQQGTDLFVFAKANDAEKNAVKAFLTFLTNAENQTQWGIKTGYVPVRKSAIESDAYKNSGSLIAPILADATKSLFSNPVQAGGNDAYKEAGKVLEGILADPANANVEESMKAFKTTLEGIWQ